MSFWNRGEAKINKFRFDELERISRKGSLLKHLKSAGKLYTPDDLEEMIFRYSKKLEKVDSGYSEELIAFAKIQIIDGYHKMMTAELDDIHANVKLAGDFKRFIKFAETVCGKDDESSRLRTLKFIIAAFTVFIEEEPVHPVGLPFPGGLKVERFDGIYYCPVRSVWNDIDDALCRFCPAVQSREQDMILSKKEREFVAKEEKLDNYFYNFKG